MDFSNGLNSSVIECVTREAWLLERKKRIQASDCASILGESPWGSPTSVFADKTVATLVDTDTERFAIGRELELPICAMYRRKFGGKVNPWTPYAIAVSKQYPWMGATPDGTFEDPDRSGIGLLEIKTASEFSRHEWRESAPLHYQIQVQAGMAVTGLQWSVLAVLIGVSSIERIFVERNDTFIEAMIGVLADFATCLEMRVAPPVDGSPATARALAKLHPADSGKTVRLSAEADNWIARLLRLKSLGKRIDEQVTGIENELKSQIGDATYGVTPGDQWTSWKSQHRKEFTVAASDFRVLRSDIKPPKQIEYADAAQPAVDFKVAKRKQLPLEWKVRLLAQAPNCRWCGATLTLRTATFEHLTPLAVGGTNEFKNLALACLACNQARGCDATLTTTSA